MEYCSVEDILHALLKYKNIVFVCVGDILAIEEINNETLANLASHWPNVREIWLNRSIWPGTSRVTLEGLVNFVRRCPKLNHLKLPIDFATPAEMPIDVAGEQCIERQFLWDFGRSTLVNNNNPSLHAISHTNVVAAYLSRAFLDLELVWYNTEPNFGAFTIDLPSVWKNLHDLYQIVRDISTP